MLWKSLWVNSKKTSDSKKEFELTLRPDNDDIPIYVKNLQKIRDPKTGTTLPTKSKAMD